MRILFVSSEDRCRGPMARLLAERLARKSGLDDAVFDSCGLLATAGSPPSVEAATFLKTEKYPILDHRSKPLSPPLADGADVIFCMTRSLTEETKTLLGASLAPKVVLLNDAIDLSTTRMDVEPPAGDSVAALRRLYASLSASMGRLVRTLEDPMCVPEYFGAKTLPKQFKPGAGGTGTRGTTSTLDPEKRLYLANTLFDLIERSFEPHTTTTLIDALKARGTELSKLEVEELLRQDLHNSVRQDKDLAWHVMSGATEKRREAAKAQARARAAAEEQRRTSTANQKPAMNGTEDKLTEEVAYQVLGVTSATPRSDAQAKYRALLKRYHPDKFHDDPEFRDMAEAKAKRINMAWKMVRDRLPGEGDGEDDE